MLINFLGCSSKDQRLEDFLEKYNIHDRPINNIMSSFLLYFEEINQESKNYKGFAEVGLFQTPETIFSGSIRATINGRNFNAAIISDKTHQSCNGFFQENSERADNIKILFNFIENRLTNDCIIPNIAKFIFNNQSTVNLNAKWISINIEDARNNFNRDLFDEGYLLRLW